MWGGIAVLHTKVTHMQITINGEPHTLDAPITVGTLLAPFRSQGKAVVLELNGEVAPPDEQPVTEGDQVEIVTFVGGG